MQTRAAVLGTLKGLGPWTFALTWNFNHSTFDKQEYSLLSEFDKRINRSLLSKKHHLLPDCKRILFIAIKAHKSAPHYHGVIKVPSDKHERFLAKAPEIWNRIWPAGSLHIGHDPNSFKWQDYIAFNDNWHNLSDEFFVSTQFRTRWLFETSNRHSMKSFSGTKLLHPASTQ